MRFVSIEFDNWRQFYGKQKINFSQELNRKVSVVYGTNGAAKTTILNAFLWTLYGPRLLTPDFMKPSQMVNSTFESESSTGQELDCTVTVVFTHRGSKYKVRRAQTEYSMQETGRIRHLNLELTITEPDGNSLPTRRAKDPGNSKEYQEIETLIEEVLPSRLARHFFFNGERFADRIATSQQDLSEDIRYVLGLKEYERARDHIAGAITKVNENIKDAQTQKVRDDKLNEIRLAEQDLKTHQQTLEQITKESDSVKEEKNQIDERLKADKKLNGLALKREGLEKLQTTTYADIEDIEIREARRLGNGVSLYLLQHRARILELADQHRAQRHIPAAFQRQFIDDLLSRGFCICGQELTNGSAHRHNVEHQRDEAGIPEVTERWNVLNSSITELSASVARIYEEFMQDKKAYQSKVDESQTRVREIARITSEMNEVSGRDLTGDEVRSANTKRDQLESQIISLCKQQGSLDEKILAARNRVDKLTEELDEIDVVDAKARLDQRRIRLMRAVKTKIEQDLATRVTEVRTELEDATTKIFQRLAAKDWSAELSPELDLQMMEQVGDGQRPVAMGTGELQSANYAFICAVSSLAAEERGAANLDDGFPIVVDAPFNVQESTQRLRIAIELPLHTAQLILLSHKEARAPLLEPAVSQYIGAEIVATLYTKSDKVFSDTIDVAGRTHDYVVVDASLRHPKTVLVQASGVTA
jgi:DNA sulfur modification protein DndD